VSRRVDRIGRHPDPGGRDLPVFLGRRGLSAGRCSRNHRRCCAPDADTEFPGAASKWEAGYTSISHPRSVSMTHRGRAQEAALDPGRPHHRAALRLFCTHRGGSTAHVTGRWARRLESGGAVIDLGELSMPDRSEPNRRDEAPRWSLTASYSVQQDHPRSCFLDESCNTPRPRR